MKTTKLAMCLCVCMSMVGIHGADAQMPSLDSFLAPIANQPEKGLVAPTAVKEPDKVKVSEAQVTEKGPKTPVVEAATAQDAVVAAVQEMKKEKKDVVHIKAGSGIGVVARGYSSYSEYPNRNATLISKRQAYVKAFMDAKKNLTQHLNGLSVQAKQELAKSMDLYDDANKSLANTENVLHETNEQKIEGLIRGFVTYDVSDNMKDKEVEVSIVTTPKTRGETMRASGGVIIAETLQDGMRQVFSELRAMIIPPDGGKVISVPDGKGEQLYFVAFGSEIVRDNKNPEVRRELRTQAADTAKMRAAANLCGLLLGDKNLWKSGFSTTTSQQNKQFDVVTKEDPLSKATVVTRVPLEQTQSAFESTMSKKTEYKSFQAGKLPPGLDAVQWETADGDWMFAAYVYNPYLTLEAENIKNSMLNGPSILERGNSIADKQPKKPVGAAVVDQKDEPDSKDKPPVGQGPSGPVSGNEKL